MDDALTPMSDWEGVRSCLGERMRLIREELYGVHGAPLLAAELRVSLRRWLEFETGHEIPAELLLRFIQVTDADPHWLLTGEGDCFRRGQRGIAGPTVDDAGSQ